MIKPSIFVGSSTEGLEVARAVQYQLRDDGEVELWDEDVFSLGHSTLESLVKALNRFDFAVLVLTPDDLTVSRGTQQSSARDNVLIELGLFIGRITEDRTFLLVCKDNDIRVPSDLAGITFATFSMPADTQKLISAVGPACVKIRNLIRKQGEAIGLKRIAEAVSKQGEAVQKQGEELHNQREVIRLIYEALRRSLTKYEYQHLVELESSATLPDYQYSDFLRDEMIRLCQHGYAEETFNRAVWEMQRKGDARFDLKEFIRITEEGKDHLKLLRKFEAFTVNERSGGITRAFSWHQLMPPRHQVARIDCATTRVESVPSFTIVDSTLVCIAALPMSAHGEEELRRNDASHSLDPCPLSSALACCV